MIQHAKAAAQSCDLSALQMHEADDVGKYLAIAVEVGRGADELHVAANAGEILPELRQQSRRRIAVVVERVVRKRVADQRRSEEHTSELQSRFDLVCRLLLEKKNN